MSSHPSFVATPASDADDASFPSVLSSHVWPDIWPPPPLAEPADAPVRIAYSREYALCLRLFAVVTARGETSRRASDMAGALIEHCPA